MMDHPYMKAIGMLLTVINILILIFQDFLNDNISEQLALINYAISFVYLAELLAHLYSRGIKQYSRSFVNLLDATVAITSIVEASMVSVNQNFREPTLLSAVRVVRVIRILNQFKFMNIITAVIKATVEQYTYVALILLLFMFMYALLGMQLYGNSIEWGTNPPRTNFDTLLNSFMTLFQLLTLENWVDILEILYGSPISRWVTIVYIISWIMLGTYIIFNLFLALLLGGFDEVDFDTNLQEKRDEYKVIEEQIALKELEEEQQKEVFGQKIGQQDKDIMYIIDDSNLKSKIGTEDTYLNVVDKQTQRDRASYFIVRNTIDDQSSLDEVFETTLNKRLEPRKSKYTLDNNRMLYEGINEELALNFFTKNSIVRRSCALVVSHPIFEKTIMILIGLSMIKLITETYINDIQAVDLPTVY